MTSQEQLVISEAWQQLQTSIDNDFAAFMSNNNKYWPNESLTGLPLPICQLKGEKWTEDGNGTLQLSNIKVAMTTPKDAWQPAEFSGPDTYTVQLPITFTTITINCDFNISQGCACAGESSETVQFPGQITVTISNPGATIVFAAQTDFKMTGVNVIGTRTYTGSGTGNFALIDFPGTQLGHNDPRGLPDAFNKGLMQGLLNQMKIFIAKYAT